jgi:L-aminopeptidase/D-esterase-like protein
MKNTLTDVPGFRVGHATMLDAATGCTVILCPPETVGAVDVRGGAPGTREAHVMDPDNVVQHVNAVVLSGGSAFGLGAADGVMRYLAERKIGYPAGENLVVPIVPAAILFDLAIGQAEAYPDAEAAYNACKIAGSAQVAQGSVGAGTGAMIGAFMGKQFATKGGIGSASMNLGGGLIVSALVAVNSVGDVIGEAGEIMAGVRVPPDGDTYMGALNALRANREQQIGGRSNTVIGAVATNAKLSKAQAQRVSQMAHDGIARAVKPAHTLYDGDTLFTLASGTMQDVDVNLIGAFAAEMVTQAIRNAVQAAQSVDGVRVWDDIATA